MRKLKVLIAGRSRDAVDAVQNALEDNTLCRTDTRVMTNGSTDPLQGVSPQPDLLLFCENGATDDLELLASQSSSSAVTLVVLGNGDSTDTIRMAMRAGARDYLPFPVNKQELFDLVADVSREVDSRVSETGHLHVFINGKGGSGASFLAANVAHGLSSSDNKVTLVDLDLQFAGLGRYLDLAPKREMLDAVDAVEDLDEVSAAAYTSEHESGLRLLAGKTEKLTFNASISPERLVATLQTYQAFNDFVIVDLPRHIDALSTAVLEAADRVSIVMQQSFPHLHDSIRLVKIMREYLGIPSSMLNVVVNRYSKDSPILLKDIEQAMEIEDIIEIPNHYRLTVESVNSGVPLAAVTTSASVARGVENLHRRIGGESDESLSRGPNVFRRLFAK